MLRKNAASRKSRVYFEGQVFFYINLQSAEFYVEAALGSFPAMKFARGPRHVAL